MMKPFTGGFLLVQIGTDSEVIFVAFFMNASLMVAILVWELQYTYLNNQQGPSKTEGVDSGFWIFKPQF